MSLHPFKRLFGVGLWDCVINFKANFLFWVLKLFSVLISTNNTAISWVAFLFVQFLGPNLAFLNVESIDMGDTFQGFRYKLPNPPPTSPPLPQTACL